MQVPLDQTRFLNLGAGQGEAEMFLRTFADVLGLECNHCNVRCRAFLDSEDLPSSIRGENYRRLVRENDCVNILFQANAPILSKNKSNYSTVLAQSEVIVLRGMLGCAVTYENLYDPGDFVLFHGSLLEDGNEAILLFGESGIGKSTTRNRWIEEGGSSAADDLILCFRDGEDFYARCLPTWSDWFKNGSQSRRYPVAEPRRIKSILWLSRGKETQYTAPAPPAVWHAQLMSAMAVHSNYAMRYFTQDEKSAYLDHIWNFICKIDEKFEKRGLFAHLDHPLKPTLAEEFSK